jgi:hypothetical protein
VLRVLIAEDDRVALAPYHKPDLAVLDLRLADGDLGAGINRRVATVWQAQFSVSNFVVLPPIGRSLSLCSPFPAEAQG